MSPFPSTVVAGLSLPPSRTLSPDVLSNEAGEGFDPEAVGLRAGSLSCILGKAIWDFERVGTYRVGRSGRA